VPRPRAAAEHVPAHDGRAGAGEDVLGEGCARVDLAAFLAVALAEPFSRYQQIVELLTADSERVLRALVGTGDVAVERHGDVQLELAHRNPPISSLLLLVGLDDQAKVIGPSLQVR